MKDPQNMGAWETLLAGDAVSQAVAAILLLMSMVSWYYLLSRSWFTWQANRGLGGALAQYWDDLDSGNGTPSLERLQSLDRCALLLPLARAASLIGVAAGIVFSPTAARLAIGARQDLAFPPFYC